MTSIGVVGLGYVGYSTSLLYAQRNKVTAVDIDPKKVDLLNQRKAIQKDDEAKKLLETKKLNLVCSTDYDLLKNSEVVFLSLPTNFDVNTRSFNTTTLENVISKLLSLTSENTSLVIKSTVPIGFTKKMNSFHDTERIFFSPEFLREGSALNDNFFPDRIIVGGSKKRHSELLSLFSSITKSSNVPLLGMSSCEAESVKLMSNTFLAMRVAFFNELDSFALESDFDIKNIINGVCLDSRIGSHYNNPSFGYGGYCLPKDTKQLESQISKVSHNDLIKSLVASNASRKNFLSTKILSSDANIIGFYGLAMKKDSDNYRESSVIDILRSIKDDGGKEIIIYDDDKLASVIEGIELMSDFDKFVEMSDMIVANRLDDKIMQFSHKLFTRDLYGRD